MGRPRPPSSPKISSATRPSFWNSRMKREAAEKGGVARKSIEEGAEHEAGTGDVEECIVGAAIDGLEDGLVDAFCFIDDDEEGRIGVGAFVPAFGAPGVIRGKGDDAATVG